MSTDVSSTGRVITSDTMAPATAPTLYFVGVTTGRSSIQRVFPRWAEHLGLSDAVLCGIDVPIHAPEETYRRIVDFIKNDPQSLGALVTTHKIDLYRACVDQFDVIDTHAWQMGEVSCLSKSDGRLHGHAKDPISSALALDDFVPAGHWLQTGGEVLIMGAGGSAIAISWYLSQRTRQADRPRQIIVTNRSMERLERLQEIHAGFDTDMEFSYALTPELVDNDRVVNGLRAGSLVINATGLGKDAPGSPLEGAATFPDQGFAWDLNYRGDLVFLEQARAQVSSRRLHVEDGWNYFLHGWTQVIGEVFHLRIPTSGPSFDALSKLASDARG